MAETSGFALRLPPDLKAAAKALTQTYFYEWDGEQTFRTLRGVNPSSINEAIIYLMQTGLRSVLSHLDKSIVEAREKLDLWQEIVTFFFDNPVAERARAANFPDGPAKRFIEEVDREYEDEPGDPGGISRQQAMTELAGAQRVLAGRIAAKGAIQKALASQ